MSTKYKTERGLACPSEDLRVVRICEWLCKDILVLLMFRNLVSKKHEDGLI